MIKSAVTISLVSEARGGPFIFWDDFQASCATAAELGFDAVELFAPSPTAVDLQVARETLDRHSLRMAAIGTGGGMVKHGWSLTAADPAIRKVAKEFIASMIVYGGAMQAPAIVGSMQGKWGGEIDRARAFELLRDALNELGALAADHGVPLIYEPLNRYETNLIRTIEEGIDFLATLETRNVKFLADLFHMNIEEANIADAIRLGKDSIGHVHFADSNRRAAGLGHTVFAPIVEALHDIGYQGYLSAEAFPLPDSRTAAMKTIEAFRRLCRP